MNIDLNIKDYTAEVSDTTLRKTLQYAMPSRIEKPAASPGTYNIFPVTSLGATRIFGGYASLAQWIIEQRTVLIDGYVGVFWKEIEAALQNYFSIAGLSVQWIRTEDFLKSSAVIDRLVKPFLGEEDSVWGSKCSLALSDFYEVERLQSQLPGTHDLQIVIGPAAVLSNWEAAVIYIDLPKNELQFRMRAGSVFNLGMEQVQEPAHMYKRFYFVDWVLLNDHKKRIQPRIAVVADGQWTDDITWMLGTTLRGGLEKLSTSVLRVKPWFEPGAWGGQWIKEHIPQLNKEVINYAWSFELIVPENGLVFESDGFLLEVSFDFLMFQNKEAVLGRHAATFGDEFPIRFDFLDTFRGGNLSIQCHPSLGYIRKQFGEKITQDETYYILDCDDKAHVYLGFQEDIEPQQFREALEVSQKEGVELNIEDYVQVHAAQKHDLFLIPNQTVHSAGAGSLVLEISATPYIFTFKMYDWLRLDLDKKPRPINIEHAFKNLDFGRKGRKVQDELISKQVVLTKGPGWQVIHLPTHSEHFYDIHRLEFENNFSVQTGDTCHVLMLVEGQSVMIETEDGTKQRFAYAETFVVPAAAKSYRLTNTGNGQIKVIKAFLK